jgi:D-glycero-D-manno-heptose 1,7-bisphosphate phosphatase
VSGTGAVFLDRDGVLADVVWREGTPAAARVVSEFRLTANAAMLEPLRLAGMHAFVVTNQPDVARGLLSPAALALMTQQVCTALQVDDVRCCLHDDFDECACRKPGAAMILELAVQWRVDLRGSYVVGDTWRDMAAARAADCRGVLISRSYNTDAVADMRVSSLSEAIAVIVAKGNQP